MKESWILSFLEKFLFFVFDIGRDQPMKFSIKSKLNDRFIILLVSSLFEGSVFQLNHDNSK